MREPERSSCAGDPCGTSDFAWASPLNAATLTRRLVGVLAFPRVLQDAPCPRVYPHLLGGGPALDVERVAQSGSAGFPLQFLIRNRAGVRLQRDRARFSDAHLGVPGKVFAFVGKGGRGGQERQTQYSANGRAIPGFFRYFHDNAPDKLRRK